MTEQELGNWIQALRSGLYQQAQGALYACGRDGRIVQHCCLAVLYALQHPDMAELAYPTDIPEVERIMADILVPLNDYRDADQYAGVLSDLEGAPECYITAPRF